MSKFKRLKAQTKEQIKQLKSQAAHSQATSLICAKRTLKSPVITSELLRDLLAQSVALEALLMPQYVNIDHIRRLNALSIDYINVQLQGVDKWLDVSTQLVAKFEGGSHE